jgi:hypothetical protein
MPIRINLLAEALAAEDLRRRDPVKRAIVVGVFLVALSLVYYSSVWLAYVIDKKGLNSVQTEIQARTNDYAQVQSSLKKISETQHRIDALQQLSAARFLQGNLMNALQQTYVPNVQLDHLRVQQDYTASAAIPAKTNNFGVIPGHPSVVTEHVVLTLDAKDFSPNPGDQVNHFKDAMIKQAYFKPGLDPTNGIRLASLSSLLVPADSKPFVQFTLECRFLDRPSTP